MNELYKKHQLFLDKHYGKILIAITVMGLTGVLGATYENNKLIQDIKRKPIIYTDLNKDGIEDKIIRTYTHRGLLGPMVLPLAVHEDTLYGTKINDKIFYLSKEQFERYSNL